MCARRTVTGLEWPILARVTSRDDYHDAPVYHPGGHYSPGIRGKPAAFPEASTDDVRLVMTQIQNFVFEMPEGGRGAESLLTPESKDLRNPSMTVSSLEYPSVLNTLNDSKFASGATPTNLAWSAQDKWIQGAGELTDHFSQL